MRRILVILSFVLLTLAGPQSVWAQEKATQEKIALVDRLFKAMDFEKTMSQMFSAILPAMTQELKARAPELTDEEARIITEASLEVMNDYILKVMEGSKTVYAESFSEEELLYLVSFYENPMGRVVMAKMPAMMPKIVEIASKEVPNMESKIIEKVCKRIDCDARKIRANLADASL